MWRWLRDWLRRRAARPLGGLRVVLYTRAGCHLCHIAHDQLQREQRRYGFGLELVDIDGSPELRERHGTTIPVVTVAGKLRFRGGVNAVLLRRLLDAEVRRARSRAADVSV